VVVVRPCTLLIAWTGTDPRGETFLAGEGRCCRTDFGNDLLCGIHSQTWYFRQPLDRILVRAEQTGQFLIQLADLLLKELQLLQRHL